MIKPIMKDPMFLSHKSTPAAKEDMPVAVNLLDTLSAHSMECVGMAANMIGVSKNIIIFFDEDKNTNVVMFNPVITKKSGPYQAEEGCLSLTGTRTATRYNEITVEYQDMSLNKRRTEYSGFTAQIIQHEIDHTNGIII